MRVAVALSCGVDALSGRAAPVLSELYAIGLARQLSADLVGVHVGAATPLLRDYAAYGLNRIDVLMDNAAEEHGAGPVGALLAAWLRANTDIRILVTGHRACGGLDSGLVPFEVAHALDWAVVSDVAEVVGASDTEEKSSGTLQVLQARPRGVRRPVFIDGPCVLAAHDRTGNVPVRVHAIGRAARIEKVHLTTTSDERQDDGVQGDIRPWRARPRLMSGASDATKGNGNVLVAPSADEAAQAIMNHLRQLGLGPSGAASRNVTQ